MRALTDTMDRNRDTQEAARAVGGAGPTGYGMEQLIPVINKLQDVREREE